MKRYVPPKWLGLHRLAGKALYRALLSQCAHLPLPPDSREGVRNLVRQTFRRSQQLQSERILGIAFKAGYEAVSLMRSAVAGSQESADRIATLLSSTYRRRSQVALKSPAPTPTASLSKPPFRPPLPYPGALSILERPHLSISGRRRVPSLINANRHPMLRFKRPQSSFLSRVIRNKIDQSDKYFVSVQRYEADLLPQAQQEDAWESFLDIPGGRGTFTRTLSQAMDEAGQREKLRGEKRNILAHKMREIVQGEWVLAQEERIQRKVQKNIERRARTAELRAKGDTGSEGDRTD